jgi:hypothetical protein
MRPGATATMSTWPRHAHSSAAMEQHNDHQPKAPRRGMQRRLLQAQRGGQKGGFIGQTRWAGQLMPHAAQAALNTAPVARGQTQGWRSAAAADAWQGCSCAGPRGDRLGRIAPACATGARTGLGWIAELRRAGRLDDAAASITTMRLAWRTALRRWAMMMTVRPWQMAPCCAG